MAKTWAFYLFDLIKASELATSITTNLKLIIFVINMPN